MLLCTLLTFAQFTGTVTDEQGVKYTANDDGTTCYVSGHEENYSTTIDIPETFQGMTVTAIGDRAFSDCSSMTSINIPEGMITIGNFAFWACYRLTSITIPNSVTSIGKLFIAHCNLDALIVEEGNPKYDSRNNCNAIIETKTNTLIAGCKNTVIPNTVTTIADSAFERCYGLTSVVIPNTVTSIGNSVFYNSVTLTSVILPNTVTCIGNNMFSYCYKLTSVTIPNSVTSIGFEAFKDCYGLTSITIPNSVTNIGDNAFKECSGLTSVTVEMETPVAITQDVFTNRDNAMLYVPYGCSEAYESADYWQDFIVLSCIKDNVAGNLANVMGTDVKKLKITGEINGTDINYLRSLINDYSLTSLDLSEARIVEGGETYTVEGNTHSTENDVLGEDMFRSCQNLCSIVLPSTVTTIGMMALRGTSITSLTIPASVTSITMNDEDGGIVEECALLTEINVEEGNPYYYSVDNVVFTEREDLVGEGGKALVVFPPGIDGNYEVPSDVTYICPRAFVSCDKLTNIILPEGLTGIGHTAFWGCSALTSIVIPEGVSSIGHRAFVGCNFTSVTVKNSTPIDIEAGTFECYGKATLHVPAGCREAYEAADTWKEFWLIVAEREKTCLLPMGEYQPWTMKYVFGESCDNIQEPSADSNGNLWYAEEFDDSAWQTLTGPMARDENRFAQVNYSWEVAGSYYFLRRNFHLDTVKDGIYEIHGICDDNMDAYLNGQKLTKTDLGDANWSFNIPNSLLHTGENVLALFVSDDGYGDAYLDYGLYYYDIYEQGIKFTVNDDGITCTVSGLEDDHSTSIVIPEKIQGLTVTAIGDGAFSGTNLTSVTIPNSVTTIGDCAFEGCENLTSVTLSNSLTTIGSRAFLYCWGLTTVEIPNGVKRIEDTSFHETGITSIIIPESVEYIGERAFTGCPYLESIVVESGNQYYDSRNGCNAIIETASNSLLCGCKNSIIPEGIVALIECSFEQLGDELQSISIPGSVRSIGAYAFSSTNLTSLDIPEGVEIIEDFAFYRCLNLSSIQFPQTLTTLGDGVFRENHLLTSITIPKSVTQINGTPIWGCDGLVSIIVEDGNPVYDSRNNCNAIIETTTNRLVSGCQSTVIPDDIETIGIHAFNGLIKLKEITIPNSVKKICHRAFHACRLSSLIIPESVEELEGEALLSMNDYDPSLVSITVEREVPLVLTEDPYLPVQGILYVPAGSEEAYRAADYWKDFRVIATIGENLVPLPMGEDQPWAMKYVFGESQANLQEPSADSNGNPWYAEEYDDSAWETLTGPMARFESQFKQVNYSWEVGGSYYFLRRNFQMDSVKDGFYKIRGICDNNMDAYLNGQKLTKTDLGGFNWLFSIPSSLLHVGENVLALFVYDWDEGGAGGDAYLDYCLYYSSNSHIIDFADANVKALCLAWDTNQDGELSEAEAAAVTDLGEVFKENTDITSFDELQYFTGLTGIGDYAFYNCIGLTSVTIPSTVTSIGDFAFHGCNYLSSFIIPEGVTRLGNNAFEECYNLPSITIPSSVISIGSNAFTSTDFASIVVEEGNTIYDSRNDCNAIIEKEYNTLISGCRNTTIPSSVTSIGPEAFSGRETLTSITIPNSVTNIESCAFFGCYGLTSVTVQWETPLAIPSDVFLYNCNSNATLIVPVGCIENYRKAAIWQDFKNIVETEKDADNTLFAADAEALVGTKVVLPIELENEDEVKLCQFDLRLPAGVTVATKSNNKLDVKLTERAGSHSVSSKLLSSGDYRFIISSMDNDTFTGNEGTLVEITLDVAEDMEAKEYAIIVLNKELSVPDGNSLRVVRPADTESRLTVKSYSPGDVNNDGVVSVTDVGCAINYILEQIPSVFIFDAADMNGDKTISVTDVGLIINFILNEGAASRQKTNMETNCDKLSLLPTDGGYELMLENKDAFIGFQFDVELNDGAAIDGVQLAEADDSGHRLTYRQLGNGKWRVVCYSLTNEAFSSDGGSLLTINMTGGIAISDIRFTTADFNELRPAAINGTATGITGLEKGMKISAEGQTLRISSDVEATLRLYTLGGSIYRTLQVKKGQNTFNGLHKGIYMINNKKVILR